MILRFIGPYSQKDALAMAAVVDAHYPKEARFYIISDALRGVSMDAGARKQQSQWALSRPPLAVATISNSLITRTLGLLLQNAHQLVTGMKVPSIFCKTEAEARSWIAEQMARASAKAALR